MGGHIYRIPEVVPTTIPPKQCHKVVSHTTKFIFFTICSKGEQKDTATTAASVQEPSIQQKQVKNIEEKHKYSFFTHSSHQGLNNLPQTKQVQLLQQGKQLTKVQIQQAFPLSPGNSMQWIPFLPKEGGLIQVDIGGHPPIPTGSKQFVGNLLFLAVFRFLNFGAILRA
jgi:hypothetical protein